MPVLRPSFCAVHVNVIIEVGMALNPPSWRINNSEAVWPDWGLMNGRGQGTGLIMEWGGTYGKGCSLSYVGAGLMGKGRGFAFGRRGLRLTHIVMHYLLKFGR